MKGTAAQFEERPRKQGSQAPQEIWKGTLTRWPICRPLTASPSSTTSATHS